MKKTIIYLFIFVAAQLLTGFAANTISRLLVSRNWCFDNIAHQFCNMFDIRHNPFHRPQMVSRK